MKILSWNVNGLRSILKKDFIPSIEYISPEVICLQEIRCFKKDVPDILNNYPYKFFNSAEKPGYSGTAIFFKSPLKIFEKCVTCDRIIQPEEGRVIAVEFESFVLVNVYTPNSGATLARLDFRVNNWDAQFLKYLLEVEKIKPVIACGDFNVAPAGIDLARPKDNIFSAGFTREERESFKKYLENNFCDVFREKYPDKIDAYTWWSFRANARARNIGWRIDHFLCSKALLSRIKDIKIYSEIYGSDHAPIAIEVN